MKKTFRPKLQSGQSLVEMAISLMVILLLLVGAVEFALALFQYVTIRDAAQEGAVYASFTPDDEDGIKFRVQAAASDVLAELPEEDILVTVNGDDCEGLSGGTPNSITVEIDYPHQIMLPLVGPMIGSDTINLHAEVTNTILQPTCP